MCMHSEAKESGNPWKLQRVSIWVRAASQQWLPGARVVIAACPAVGLLSINSANPAWSRQQLGRWKWKYKGWLSILAGQDFTQHLVTFIYITVRSLLQQWTYHFNLPSERVGKLVGQLLTDTNHLSQMQKVSKFLSKIYVNIQRKDSRFLWQEQLVIEEQRLLGINAFLIISCSLNKASTLSFFSTC